jgi:very-short-patch-repair endonuclease
MPHSAVTPLQRNRAKSLRRTMTRAETLLWRYIKAEHLDGLSFRRQAPIGAYIVDFVCHDAKIIVELDGDSHDFEQRIRHDEARDAWLSTRGYLVLRFTNEQVMSELEAVLIVIRETATSGTRSVPPSLSLPRKGGGNPLTAASRAVLPRGEDL